ncbi:MAG: aminotransferase class I/II-fold pyridoxal phosphate-dependent enzyme [Bdellovibrionota bacterium]
MKMVFFFIVDESYREILFDGAEAFSILNLDAKNEHIIVIDSLSKRFSLCGARVGFLASKNRN